MTVTRCYTLTFSLVNVLTPIGDQYNLGLRFNPSISEDVHYFWVLVFNEIPKPIAFKGSARKILRKNINANFFLSFFKEIGLRLFET
jgi:hypothetical protein